MQKVAWPTITVRRLSGMPSTWVNVSLRATPVTIPGRAIGRITRKEIVSRPKKRWRADRQGGQRAEHDRDRGRRQPGLDRGQEALRATASFSIALR